MSQTGTVKTLSQVETIIDTDFHLTERQSDVAPYLEELYGKLLNVTGDDYGYHGDVFPSPGFVSPVTSGKVSSDTVRSADTVIEGMDELDIDRAIITPTLGLSLPVMHHDELAGAFATAYNSYIQDQFLDEEDRLYSAIIVAPQQPAEAAAEIDDRADDRGIVAALIPGSGVHPPLGAERYHPIYEACEDAGLPILLHNAASSWMQNYPFQARGFKRYLSVHSLSHPMDHMVNLTSLIVNGIPVQFPDLEFVLQEGGLGWIPFMMRRLDHEYRSKREDAPLLAEGPYEMPSEYILEHCYFTSQPLEGAYDPEYLSNVLDMFEAENNLMFSSDYPHLDFDHTREILTYFKGFGDSEINNIFGGTAKEVFGI